MFSLFEIHPRREARWPLCAWLLGWSLFLGAIATTGLATSSLADRFASPPAESRIIKIIHGWPDQSEAQDRIIRQLTAQGFGGVVCNVSFDHYLEGEPQWQAFARAVAEARKAGMALWLYDERGYPSGNAGGLVLRDHPEWAARGLSIADTETGAGPVTLRLPPGQPFLLAAFPVKNGQIDLKGRVLLDAAKQVRDNTLTWQAPAGRWHVMAIMEGPIYEGTHAAMNLAEKTPYINLLMAEPTARFLEVTHQRYAQHLGDKLGKSFVATFTDEPSLMSMFLKPMPYRLLPWSPDLPAQFKKRRGYDLRPIIPALVADAGSKGQRSRYDFWLTIGELVSENYFGQIQTWCRQHQIPSGGHLLAEEGLAAHVPLYGDFFRCLRRLDAPSIDCLTSVPSEVPWHIARLAASAAELEGKRVVMCETSDHSQRYRPPGDQRPVRTVTETEIRGTVNRLIVSGVNTITSYYSFANLSDEQLRRLNEWTGRCCTLLTGGHQVADIALLYPAESLWPKFNPSRLWANESPEAARIENLYRTAADGLFNTQRDFTYVDSRTLIEASVTDGSLCHGPHRWRVVVLPETTTLPLAAWKNLKLFVDQGGMVVALGALPANSETEFPSPRVQRIAKSIFGSTSSEPSVSSHSGAGIYLPPGTEGLLPTVLDGLLERDVKIEPGSSPVRVTHRRIDNHDLYFLINDSAKSWSGDIQLPISDRGEQWDPVAGKTTSLPPTNRWPLDLAPYGGTFLRFTQTRAPKKYPAKSGMLPNLTVAPLPTVEPLVVRGEFVREQFIQTSSPAKPGLPLWQVAGTITRSQVDTFLFFRFPYATPLDLSQADCLVLDTWVPEGQRSPTQLLVILQEKNGGDFLASTGRSLASPGHQRLFIPLNRFQLAGWSKDSDGQLDVSRIGEVRIGWGGYLGAEGERIQFSVATPQTGRIESQKR